MHQDLSWLTCISLSFLLEQFTCLKYLIKNMECCSMQVVNIISTISVIFFSKKLNHSHNHDFLDNYLCYFHLLIFSESVLVSFMKYFLMQNCMLHFLWIVCCFPFYFVKHQQVFQIFDRFRCIVNYVNQGACYSFA